MTEGLPESWRVVSIGSVCSKPQYGWTTSAADSGKVRLLRTTDISHGPVDWNSVPFCQDAPPDVEKYLLADGDIVVSRAGSVGISCRVKAPERAVFASYLIRFRPKEDVDGKYLALILQSPSYWAQVRGSTAGIAIPNVNASKLESFTFPLPPLPEQRRIVAEIEKQFTRLEAGVAALRRVQINLKRYRAAVLKAACEGRLVPTEAELQKSEGRGQKKAKTQFETGEALLARILTERRKNWRGRGKYKEPTAPDTEYLGPLPEGWTWATFEQISERVTVGFVGSMKHEYVESGVPFLRGQNVRENRFDPDGLLYISPRFHQTLSKSALRPGDLAVVRSGSVGVTCVIPDSLPDANCADLVLVQRPLGFVPQYGAYYMNSLAKRHVAAGKVGVALIHFNTKSVATLALPLPPLAEQTRIVAEVERRLSVVEELESVVAANLQRATRLRQAILQRAFNGKLRGGDACS